MRRFVLLLASLVVALECLAGNTLTISNTSGHPGDVVQLTLSLDNTDALVALEVQLPLDDNLEYVDGSAALVSERINGHSVSTQIKDGVLSMYIFNFNNAPLKGESGALLSFSLRLTNEPATYTLSPIIIASDASGTALNVQAVNGSVAILSPQIKVVTETVNYGHIPIRAEYSKTVTIKNSGNETLNVTNVLFSANEFSTDETEFSIEPDNTRSLTVKYNPLNRGSITENVSFVSNAVNGTAVATIMADPFSVNELHVSNASGTSDSEVELSLTMNNMEPIVAVQCQFNLPEALHFVDDSFKLSDRAQSLKKLISIDGKKLSMYIYSDNNTPISGNEGEIATFKLQLDGGSGYYSISPQSVILSNSSMENMTSSTSNGSVRIQSPTISYASNYDMGNHDITKTVSSEYAITNKGQIDLVINKISFLTEGFRIKENFPMTVSAGKTGTVTILYDATKSGDFGGSMNIYSNDPVNRMVRVSLNGSVFEPNSISLSGEFTNECKDYCLKIGLDNYTNIVAVQMDLNVPKGLDCSSSDLIGTSRMQGISHSVAKIEEGKYRILLFSTNNTSIKDNSEDICVLTLHASKQIEDGQSISLSDVILSDIGGKNHSTQDFTDCRLTYPEYSITYILDGQEYKTQKVKYGEVISPVEVPKRTGSTFSGWSGIPSTMPAHDIRITGSFRINSYILTYKVDGTDYKKDTLIYGSAITPLEALSREGYTFSGWSDIPTTMPANNVEVTGRFTVNKYRLTVLVDNKVYYSTSIAYGTRLADYVTLIEKKGIDLSQWDLYDMIETITMPAHDVQINAVVTNVKTIQKSADESVIYDMTGKKIEADDMSILPAGIYIRNGRKFVVQ